MAPTALNVRCLAYGVPSSRKPQLKVGILSDIQYANIDDALCSGSKRYYRNALTCVEQAVSSWTLQNVDCVVNLGDIIDAYNMVTDSSEQALQAVLDVFAKLPTEVDVRHVLGNHCVCHPVEREQLLTHLGMNGQAQHEVGYYAFSPSDDWRLIVLDGCEVSTYAWNREHPKFREAHEILTMHSDVKLLPDNSMFRQLLKAKRNQQIKESDYIGGLQGLNQRYVFYNGAVGDQQMQWFHQELQNAKGAEQNVLVFCHMPILPGICRPGMLLWNYDAVLHAIHQHKDIVKGVFGGHCHHFGFERDAEGIPHMVLPAVLETAPGTDGHGVIEAYGDKIIVNGFSRTDMVWNFDVENQRRKQLGTFDSERMASPAGV